MTIKRLFLDIETSLSVVATFSLWPTHIPHSHIIQEWHMICAAWKWEGQDEIYGVASYSHDDKDIVAELRQAIIEADEIVYHNGRKFDFKKLNARVICNNLPPMPKPRETDTMIQCKKHFSFTCNRLDYIGGLLGVGKKLPTSEGLWLRALQLDKDAIDEMLAYNKVDVEVLENLFKKLQPHIDVGYNVNIAQIDGDMCTHCGSTDLQARGWANTKTTRYRRYQCNTCGGWSSSGKKEPRLNPPVR